MDSSALFPQIILQHLQHIDKSLTDPYRVTRDTIARMENDHRLTLLMMTRPFGSSCVSTNSEAPTHRSSVHRHVDFGAAGINLNVQELPSVRESASSFHVGVDVVWRKNQSSEWSSEGTSSVIDR